MKRHNGKPYPGIPNSKTQNKEGEKRAAEDHSRTANFACI